MHKYCKGKSKIGGNLQAMETRRSRTKQTREREILWPSTKNGRKLKSQGPTVDLTPERKIGNFKENMKHGRALTPAQDHAHTLKQNPKRALSCLRPCIRPCFLLENFTKPIKQSMTLQVATWLCLYKHNHQHGQEHASACSRKHYFRNSYKIHGHEHDHA